MLNRVFETHLDVKNLERAMAFYRDVLGLELAMVEKERRIAFFWLGGAMNSMLGLWEKPEGEIPSRHTAFEVDLPLMKTEIARLNAAGVETFDFGRVATAVPFVLGWMPAAAIYFEDPDGHLLELIAKLPGKPYPEHAITSLEEWRGLDPAHAGVEF